MKVGWKKKAESKVQDVLDYLSNQCKVTSDGKISTVVPLGFNLREPFGIITALVEAPKELGWPHLDRCVTEAVQEAIVAGNPVAKNVMGRIQKKANTFESGQVKEYRIQTTISAVPPRVSEKRIEVRNSSIRFLKSKVWPNKYSGRNGVDYGDGRSEKLDEGGYVKVIVSTKERSAWRAFDTALDDLDYFRSFICLSINYHRVLSSEPWKPLNRVRLGCFHSVSNKYGKMVKDGCGWFEPNYRLADALYNPYSRIPEGNDGYNGFLMRFRVHGEFVDKLNQFEQQQVRKSMLRYVRALDEPDPDVAILKLWGALESLVAVSDEGKVSLNRMVERCYSVWGKKFRKFHRARLEHIRTYRNEHVHAGESQSSANEVLQQLQDYFRAMIGYYSFQIERGGFSRIEQVNRYLDFDPSDAKLEEWKFFVERREKSREASKKTKALKEVNV